MTSTHHLRLINFNLARENTHLQFTNTSIIHQRDELTQTNALLREELTAVKLELLDLQSSSEGQFVKQLRSMHDGLNFNPELMQQIKRGDPGIAPPSPSPSSTSVSSSHYDEESDAESFYGHEEDEPFAATYASPSPSEEDAVFTDDDEAHNAPPSPTRRRFPIVDGDASHGEDEKDLQPPSTPRASASPFSDDEETPGTRMRLIRGSRIRSRGPSPPELEPRSPDDDDEGGEAGRKRRRFMREEEGSPFARRRGRRLQGGVEVAGGFWRGSFFKLRTF